MTSVGEFEVWNCSVLFLSEEAKGHGGLKTRKLGPGIDLTKRKSGMHFFELKVETKKKFKT